MCANSRFDPVSGPRVCGADVEKKKDLADCSGSVQFSFVALLPCCLSSPQGKLWPRIIIHVYVAQLLAPERPGSMHTCNRAQFFLL